MHPPRLTRGLSHSRPPGGTAMTRPSPSATMGDVSFAHRVVILLTTVCVVPLAPTQANAHDGAGAAFKGRAGNYTVYAYDGFPAPGSGLTYRIVLLDRTRGRPAYGVELTGSARDEGTGRDLTIDRDSVQMYGNVGYLTVPNPYPADVAI